MKLFYTLFLSFLSFVCINTNAQESKISGRIFDKATKEPLPTANIYYKNTPIGVVSNSDGEFILKKEDNEIIIISYIGYESIEYNTDNVPENIYLTPSNIQLPELTVISVKANELVKKIWDKYHKIYEKENAIKEKPQFSFFYRQITKSDSIYNEFIECFFTGTNSYGINDLKIQKGRYAKLNLSPNFSFTFTNFFQQTQIRPFHHKNPPNKVFNTFLQPNTDKLFNVEIDKIITSDIQGDIVVLNFTPKENNREKYIFSGKLYISLKDLSIIRFEGNISVLGLDNPQIKKSTLFFSVNYKNGIKSYPIVETIKCNANFDISYNGSIHTANIEAIAFDCSYQFSTQTGKEISDSNSLIDLINRTADSPQFWQNNPIIKRTSKEEKVIRTFENKKIFGNFQSE